MIMEKAYGIFKIEYPATDTGINQFHIGISNESAMKNVANPLDIKIGHYGGFDTEKDAETFIEKNMDSGVMYSIMPIYFKL